VTRAKAPVATRTWSRTRPKATPRRVTRKTTGRSSRSPEQFNEQFRWLVMSYYPNMPLKRFERLTKLISKAIA